MNLRFLYQNILQIAGLIYATIKYNENNIASVSDYTPETKYSLPFKGKWYVVNGGITQDTSHFYSSIGVPIFFSNIQTELYGQYSKIDTRPLPEKQERAEGYIHRGLLVENHKTK